MRLWIGNMEPGTTDDEIKDFVKKYAPDLECTEIQRVEGGVPEAAAGIDRLRIAHHSGDRSLQEEGEVIGEAADILRERHLGTATSRRCQAGAAGAREHSPRRRRRHTAESRSQPASLRRSAAGSTPTAPGAA